MNIALTAVDLAKNVFQLHCADSIGHPVLCKQVKRGKLAETIFARAPALAGQS